MMWTHKFIMDRLHCTSPATMERRTKNVEVRKARESREDRHRHRTKRHDEPRRTIERSKPIHKQHLSITCTFFFSFVSFASRVLSPPFSCARFPFGPSPLFLLLSLGSTHHAVRFFSFAVYALSPGSPLSLSMMYMHMQRNKSLSLAHSSAIYTNPSPFISLPLPLPLHRLPLLNNPNPHPTPTTIPLQLRQLRARRGPALLRLLLLGLGLGLAAVVEPRRPTPTTGTGPAATTAAAAAAARGGARGGGDDGEIAGGGGGGREGRGGGEALVRAVGGGGGRGGDGGQRPGHVVARAFEPGADHLLCLGVCLL